MAIYEIKNLTFAYAGGARKVIDNLSLSIEQGDFCVICGKSGSGKSTLLRLLKREVKPQGIIEGVILYDGVKLSNLSDEISAREIGFVCQDVNCGLVCDKVWKELAFALGNLRLCDEFIEAKVAEISEYFGISKLYNKKINELSGGSKQIVLLASIMATNPKVLLLDEPTSMLDPIAKSNFINMLCRINKELGVTIIMVEHNLDSVFNIANKVFVLDNGRLVANCPPSNLPSQLSSSGTAKYVGLPEFEELFALYGNGAELPSTLSDKRLWLKKLIGNGIKKDITIKLPVEKKCILTAKNLYFRYDKKGEDIVKGASIGLARGEIVCLLGGNGGGKTTFINMLNNVLKPYAGKVWVEKNCKVAILPQNAKGLFVESSVESELNFFAKILGVENDIVQELLGKFDLKEISNLHPYDISGGEVQRLAIAKLFLTNPDIIILDEPTQGMDMSAKEYLQHLLVDCCSKGKSVIVVTHDLRFASMVADRIGMFFDGKIVALSKASDFFESNSFYNTHCSLLTRDFAKGLYSVQKICDLLDKSL